MIKGLIGLCALMALATGCGDTNQAETPHTSASVIPDHTETAACHKAADRMLSDVKHVTDEDNTVRDAYTRWKRASARMPLVGTLCSTSVSKPLQGALGQLSCSIELAAHAKVESRCPANKNDAAAIAFSRIGEAETALDAH